MIPGSHGLKYIVLGLVENQGSQYVIEYGRRVGIIQVSPEDDAERLNVKNAMASLSNLATRLFFDHLMTYCKNESRDMLCLKQNDYWTFSEIYELTEILETLRSLKVDASYKARIAKDFESYLIMKKTIQDKFRPNSNESLVLTIKEMYGKYPSKHLDWLQMINNQLLSDSQTTLEDEIMIFNPQLLEGLYKLLTELEETWVAPNFP